MSEAAVEAPAEAVEPAEVAGVAVEAAAPETPLEPAAPAFDPYDSPELLDLVEQRAAAIADQQFQHAIRQAQDEARRSQGPTPEGFFDEEGNFLPGAFAQYQAHRDEQMNARFEQAIDRLTQPLAAREQAETVAEGEQRLQDILADDISRNGEFSTDPEADKQARALVRTLADQQFPEIAQRYGMTPRAAEVALNRAADQVRGLLKANASTAVAQHVNHNATLAGVRTEPGAGGAGLVTVSEIPADPSRIGADLVSKYAIKNREAGSIY